LIKRILSLSIIATTSVLAVPNAGTILHQIPKAPLLQQSTLLPKVQQEHTPVMLPTNSKIKVLINHIVIQGNTIFSKKTLNRLIRSFEHKNLSFANMQRIANTITKYYRLHGYFLTHAYLPTQDLDNHILTINVIEGKYGKFSIKNNSLVRSNILRGYMPKSGKVVSLSSLDRRMLLINDLAGAKIVKASVYPGFKIGTSGFSLNVAKTQRIQAYAMYDNYGTKATGEYRFNGGIILNSLIGYGDSLSFSTLDSFSDSLRNLGGIYILPLGYSGLKLNLQASATKYRLQDQYALTEFTSIFMNDTIQSQDSKKHVNGLSFSISGNDAYTLFSKPARFSGNIRYTRGDVIMDNAVARANDSLVDTQGYFSKLWLQIVQNIYLTNKLTLQAKLIGQTSFSKNLDSSQKLTIGGVYGVRAYTNSELLADKGIIVSLQTNYRLPNIKNYTNTVGIFIDGSKAYKNANPYTGVVNNERELDDIGLSYMASYKFINLRVSFTHGFGPDAKSTTQPTYDNNKFFVQTSMVY